MAIGDRSCSRANRLAFLLRWRGSNFTLMQVMDHVAKVSSFRAPRPVPRAPRDSGKPCGKHSRKRNVQRDGAAAEPLCDSWDHKRASMGALGLE